MFNEPKTGELFWPSMSFHTSMVQDVLSPCSFRTRNSIYEWNRVE